MNNLSNQPDYTMEEIFSLPWVSFPADWEIKLMPNYAGSAIRLQVRRAGKESASISIIYDLHGGVAGVDGQTWEGYALNAPKSDEYPELSEPFRAKRDDLNKIIKICQDYMDIIERIENSQTRPIE